MMLSNPIANSIGHAIRTVFPYGREYEWPVIRGDSKYCVPSALWMVISS
jgi:hypothetical protein